MRKVCVISLFLVLSHWCCLVDGQSKKFACGYDYAEAAQISYLPEYVPLEVCTHVVFKWFSFPRFVNRQMIFTDNEKKLFSRLVSSVRQRSSSGTRVVASISGSGTDFSDMSGTNVRRRAFVRAITVLLLELDADGIELAWSTPGSVAPGTGFATDRLTMVTLLQDLRQAVSAVSKLTKGRNRELWIHGSVHPNLISTAYNTFDVCDMVDHVTLLSTYISGTDSHAPINSPTIISNERRYINDVLIEFGNGIIDATQSWVDNGCAPKKLLLGIGLQGFLSTVKTKSLNFYGDKFWSWGAAGENERMPYRELCLTVLYGGWAAGWDPVGLTPYLNRSLSNGMSERLSYEDVNSVRFKIDVVEQKRLGGVYTDFVHSDDIYGRCGTAYPLSAYIAYRLQAIPADIGFAIEWN